MKAAVFHSNWRWHSWCPCGETWHAPSNRVGWDFVRHALNRHVRTHSATLKGLPLAMYPKPKYAEGGLVVRGYGHTMPSDAPILYPAGPYVEDL